MVITSSNTRARNSLILGIIGSTLTITLLILLRIAGTGDATTAIIELAIGVLSFALALAAVILGHSGLRQSTQYPPGANGRNQAAAGLTLGYLSLVLLCSVLIGFLLISVFFHYVSII